MKLISLLIVVLMIVVTSCEQRGERTIFIFKEINDSNHLIKQEINSAGQLHSEMEMRRDSIPQGAYKEWSEEQLICTGTYVNGKKEGQWVYFNLAGDTSSIENWMSGVKVGSQYTYYGSRSKGNTRNSLASFSFYNGTGEKTGNAIFDMQGNVNSMTGTFFFCAYNKPDISEKDSFSLLVFFDIPELLTYHLTIQEYHNFRKFSEFQYPRSDSDLINTEFAKKKLINKKLPKGHYHWKIIMEIFENTNTIGRDSTSIDVQSR
jgi:hypothetical protein